jgi:hypothetical protein
MLEHLYDFILSHHFGVNFLRDAKTLEEGEG